MSQSRAVVVGAFVVGGLALFALALFLIGDRRSLFADNFELTTTFGRVTGLEVGTRVRVAGIDAGEILDIGLPSGPSDRFRVRLRLRRDLQPLVRTDSIGAIQTDGIVGNAFIQIGGGTEAAPMVSPGDTIEGRDPIEFADLIEEGRDTFRTVAAEVIELKEDVSKAIATLDETVMTVNGRVAVFADQATALAAQGTDMLTGLTKTTSEVQQIVSDVRAGRGNVGRLLTDDTLYTRAAEAMGNVETATRSLQATAENARSVVAGFTDPSGAGPELVRSVRGMLDQAQEVISDLSEGTEAMKRNFLIRGFFRDRGYYDLDALSREAYKQGALEGGDRTVLRIWLSAETLFQRDGQGVEQLTPEGRQRLDSAMLELSRFPRDSTLVVEGHTRADERGELPLVRSTDRAEAVREYLLSRFRRRTTITGSMALDEAPGSPSGDGRWSGVALAIFVRNDALGQR